jgi:peroxiredoxin
VISVRDQLPDTELQLRSYLSDGPLLILFFSEANTPLCTQQLCAFRDDFEMIAELHASTIAISSDPPEEQERFVREHHFPFPLLSDHNLDAASVFGVADPTNKRAQRAAFVADSDGVIQLAIPFYQPNNLDHFQDIFGALGLDI